MRVLSMSSNSRTCRSIRFLSRSSLQQINPISRRSTTITIPLSGRGYATGQSHYDILSVSRDSTTKEIKARFYELSRKYHPDVSPDSAKRFTEINAAYSVLREENSRRDYDRTLPSERRSSASPSPGYRTASGLNRGKTRPMGSPPPSPFKGSYPGQPDRPASFGFGFGSRPTADGDVKSQHFRYEEHKERHSTFDGRYNMRLQEELSRRNTELKDNFFARFFGIGGLIFIVIMLTGGIANVRAETPVSQDREEKAAREIDWLEAMTSRRSVFEPRFCKWKD